MGAATHWNQAWVSGGRLVFVAAVQLATASCRPAMNTSAIAVELMRAAFCTVMFPAASIAVPNACARPCDTCGTDYGS